MAPEPSSGLARWLPLAVAAIVPGLLFFVLPPLNASGLWDPYELNIADLARRVALNLHGASNLALENADNSLPFLNDLGRPQLPFTSIALGFKIFGLHEWAGRAPLALWGLLGALASYGFVARLVDRRAGMYTAIALCTMPLYFVQARTMMGDIVAMSALAMAFGGLLVAVFDRDLTVRLLWLGIGVAGLLAGFYSRGGLLGVGVPALGVGLSWLVVMSHDHKKRDALGAAVALASLFVGGLCAWKGILVFTQDKVTDLSPWLGVMVKSGVRYPTFDQYIAHIGHALAPWSAFAPFALGRLFLAPIGREGDALERESVTRMAVLVGFGVAFAAYGLVAPRTDLLAFTGPALLAAASGMAIRDYERGAHHSVAVAVGTLVLLGVLHHDFHEMPDKAYQAFAVLNATFPESFKPIALNLWWVALGGFGIVAFFTWVEKDSARSPFDPANYGRIIKSLREAFDGLLALFYFAMVAGASIAALAVYFGLRTSAKWVPASSQVRFGILNAWWMIAFIPLGVILGLYFASDLWLWAFGRSGKFGSVSLSRGFEPFENLIRQLRGEARATKTENAESSADAALLVPFLIFLVPALVFFGLQRAGLSLRVAIPVALPSGLLVFLVLGAMGDLLRGSRAAFFAVGAAIVGAILCTSFYPALANQLSPKEVFESYERKHKSGEPLALFGVGGRTAAYYAGGQPQTFQDVESARAWLTAGSERRFLALKADELARLNHSYREQSDPRANLPILDARSSQILLAASRLSGGEENLNPLSKFILAASPKPQRAFEANLDDKLMALGFDVIDPQGRLANVVAPGKSYHMRFYYKVLQPITTEWESFIHIDGFQRRHNGDHKPMKGKYPFSLWLKDDYMVDDHEFKLEPNFSPGQYSIYYGLFVGETRMRVKSGPNDGDNRINGGTLQVQ